jgi:prevent-host-death family protein
MISVGAYEAKTRFSQLLENVAKGEQVVITKHGVPIAKIVPMSVTATVRREDAILQLQELSLGVDLNGQSIKELVTEGRR